MNAAELAAALGAKWHGSYGTCRCPAHDDRRPSLSIRNGEHGILLKCHAGCAPGDIIAILRQRGLWPEREAESTDKISPRRQTTSNASFALDIWRQCQAAGGTLVEIYLRGRGITIPPPASLRYHPGLRHAPTGLSLPCMVAGVQAVDGSITGIQRVFLRTDGAGKAGVASPKMMLGEIAGGAVRFAKAAPKLSIGEGIETMLAVLQATGVPCWAALSTSGLKALSLPPEVREVLIFADGDEAGEKAAQEAGDRFANEGRDARIVRPPPDQDFNDVLAARPTDDQKGLPHER